MSKEPKTEGGTRGKASKKKTIELESIELHTSAQKSEMLKALGDFADNIKKLQAKVDLDSHDTYRITLVVHDSSHKSSTTIHVFCNGGNGNGW